MRVAIIMLSVLLGVSSVANGYRRAGKTSSLATFNAILLPDSFELQARETLMIKLIKESNVDVICLQEIWKTDSQRNIYNGVRHLYPYSVSLIDLNAGQSTDPAPACSETEFNRIISCVQAYCTAPDDITCPVRACAHVLIPLSFECKYCIIFHLGTTGNISRCSYDPAVNYEKTYGLMLLSKKEITENKTDGYLGNVSQARGFLQASVKDIGEIFCTHLSTGLSGFENIYIGPPLVYPLLYTSYGEQQYQEVVRLLNEASVKDNSVLLGDFNHGPALATSPDTSNISHVMPFQYGYVNARGYYSPYVLMDGRCTFCAENPNVRVSSSEVIDHIYIPVTASSRVISAKRIWDSEYTDSGMPLSDHYGVKVVLRDLTCSCDWWFCFYHEGRNYFPTSDTSDRELRNICEAV